MGDSVKLVVLGTGAVGKSSVTTRYVKGDFLPFYDPTVEDSYTKQETVGQRSVYVEILDTAGTDQFKMMREIYLKNSEGFIVVYSISSGASFNSTDEILKSIEEVKGADQPIILVGNKADLEDKREVLKENGKQKADSYHAKFMEVSAKTNTGIDELFKTIINDVCSKKYPTSSSGCCVVM